MELKEILDKINTLSQQLNSIQLDDPVTKLGAEALYKQLTRQIHDLKIEYLNVLKSKLVFLNVCGNKTQEFVTLIKNNFKGEVLDLDFIKQDIVNKLSYLGTKQVTSNAYMDMFYQLYTLFDKYNVPYKKQFNWSLLTLNIPLLDGLEKIINELYKQEFYVSYVVNYTINKGFELQFTGKRFSIVLVGHKFPELLETQYKIFTIDTTDRDIDEKFILNEMMVIKNSLKGD